MAYCFWLLGDIQEPQKVLVNVSLLTSNFDYFVCTKFQLSVRHEADHMICCKFHFSWLCKEMSFQNSLLHFIKGRGCLCCFLGVFVCFFVFWRCFVLWDGKLRWSLSFSGVCNATRYSVVTTATYGFLYSLVSESFFCSVGGLQWISAIRHNARNLRGRQSEVTLDYAKWYLILFFFWLRILLYFYQHLLTKGQLVPVVKRWWETVFDEDHMRMSLQMRCEVLSYVILICSGEK